MKHNSFGRKLWLCFALFAAAIFAVLWFLQTVFLQTFYNRMTIRNVEKAAAEIVGAQESGDWSALLDTLATDNSLLIFVTDGEGNVLYSADEHTSLYGKERFGGGRANPYLEKGQMNWQAGAFRNLPRDYDVFLARLSENEGGFVGYNTGDGTAYVCGAALDGGRVLYISTPLGAVGAAVGILRIQLLWVTVLSLALGFLIARSFSRRFARPVADLTLQARHLAEEDFSPAYQAGFCAELDDLSESLNETSVRLRRLENARRELLTNVSHDLRTPLTMIKGYAEMVRDISWRDDAQREEDLAVIIRESDRLTDLVNEILDASSLQGEQGTGPREPFDLSAAARSVVDQFSPLCTRRDVALHVEIEPGQWVIGGEKQLKRVLYNWLDNAIRHSGAGQRVQMLLKGSGGTVRAEVRDQGEGISREDLPYIWDRYFTARERQGGGGTGLGLAITKEILQSHRARFGVESDLGKGSVFWFELDRVDR